MKISLLPTESFPFGNNIHFVYGLRSGQFIFLHNTLHWILNDISKYHSNTIISKITPEDLQLLTENFHKVQAGTFSGKITIKLLSMEGNKWLMVTPWVGEYQGEKIISGSVVDVTDEVTNTQSIVKFADKKNSILHMLGHDLRGPLNMAKSLMKKVDQEISDPLQLKKTGHIADILQQSIDLISDLVKREFLETANASLVMKRVDIVGRLSEYIEECHRSENIAALSFQLKGSANEIYINLDIAKFMQVVNNLISNSMKFTPAGGTIQVYVKDQPNEVQFTFSDNGIGIPEAHLPQIFDKLTIARRPGLQGEPALGLGLSIVRTIIEWHQGKISCKSKEGFGTTFLITIPKN